jgi:DnaJ-class molecular chaperone
MSNKNKNLYHILELDNNCSYQDIKKSYKKLVLKYHPDKTGNNNDSQKFIDIQNAYVILSNPEKRKKYDLLNNTQQIKLYDFIQNFINIESKFMNNFIDIFFDNNIENLKNNINNMNFNYLFNQIKNKLCDIDLQSIFKLLDLTHNNNNSNNNIYGTIETSYEDRYMDKYHKIIIKRKTKDDKIIFIPLRKSIYILKNEGEYNKNKIIIYNSDIYYNYNITEYEYNNGGQINILFLDNKKLIYNHNGFNNNHLIILKNKGMPLNEQNTKEIKRGNLYIIPKIIK